MIVTGTMAKLLAPGIYSVFRDKYTEQTPKGDMFFNEEKSNRKWIDSLTYAAFGYPEKMSEGDRYPLQNPTQGPGKRVEAVKYGMAYEITREARSFDQYGVISQLTAALAESMVYFRDLMAADVLVRGNTNVRTTGYGKNLFDAAHVIVRTGATQSNLLSSAPLSPASLQITLQKYRTLKNAEGRTIQTRPKYLVVGTNNEFTGRAILGNTNQPTLAATDNWNNKNLLAEEGLQLVVWDKLDALLPNGWFLLPDKAYHRLFKYEPLPPTNDLWDEPDRQVTVHGTTMFLTYDFWSEAGVLGNFQP